MKKRHIAVVTGSRAEFGLMKELLKELKADRRIRLSLIASAMHLEPAFGNTYKEIEAEGFVIAQKVKMISRVDTAHGIASSISRGVKGFADAFERLNPDLVVLVGDRFEMLAAATAGMALGLPMAHIGGGENTLGAMDDAIRHAISKMSHLHFCSNDAACKRLVRMGEPSKRVFYVGALGLTNLTQLPLLSREDLCRDLKIPATEPITLITFHPETLKAAADSTVALKAMLLALNDVKGNLVFTGSNADAHGRAMLKIIEKFVQQNPRAKLFLSLGRRRYLSLLKQADLMIGNSSSGIWEAPSFKLPVVNIGDRQEGRLRAKNVIDVGYAQKSIRAGIKKALSPAFQKSLARVHNPYFRPGTVKRISKILVTVPLNQALLKKGNVAHE